jgi:hypothetical protein
MAGRRGGCQRLGAEAKHPVDQQLRLMLVIEEIVGPLEPPPGLWGTSIDHLIFFQ